MKKLKIQRLGHAMFLFHTEGGSKYLVDPFFDHNPAFPQEFNQDSFFREIHAIFLTHGHFDHTSGLEKVKSINPQVFVFAPYELALHLMQNGMKNVIPLNFGGSTKLEDVEVTMVPAKHSSSYKELDGTPLYAGEAAGYVFDFQDSVTVYFSGDTTVMMDMKLIQEIYEPDIAILSASGQFTMGPREAAYAVRNLLDVKYVIPSHTFPTLETAPNPEVLQAMVSNFPVIENMMARDYELKELLADFENSKVIIMGYGETVEF